MKNMTKGNIPKQLMSFALPLILGNMFQLTYNMVDSIVIGKFSGKESLAAVGASNPIMNIIIFFIVGICMGASVIMSEYYGAGNEGDLRKEVSTTIIVGLAFTVAVSIICSMLIKPILYLIQTPEEIIGLAATYLRIILLGLVFTFFYNVYSSALRSIGDSKTPIIFLMIASVINVVLDILFVGVLKMDVAGAAYSTIIAQAFSAIACIIYVYKKVPLLQVKGKQWKVDVILLKKTVNYSWATAMQQTCLYFGKFLVQGAINPLGVDVIATFNAVTKVDDFAFTPEQSISHSMTTFIAQNRGANQEQRMKKGFRIGMLIEFVYWIFIFTAVFFGAPYIMKLFVTEGDYDIIPLGVSYLRPMAFFYLLPAITNGLQGYFRGMGKMRVTLVATAVQMLFRVGLVYLLAPKFGITGIAFACMGGWIAMLAYEIPLYKKHIKGGF
ncbi:MAG: MATE family efflux transporter [Clostridiales bacterium]|nr:MATE family efflux transporter [Clostridiales bacterium]